MENTFNPNQNNRQSRFEGFKATPSVSTETTGMAIEGLTSIFFRNLFTDKGNIDTLLGQIDSERINKIMGDTMTEFNSMITNRIKSNYQNLKNQLGRDLTKEEHEIIKNHPFNREMLHLLLNPKDAQSAFIKYLDSFGLSIKESESDPLDQVLDKEHSPNTLGLLDAVSIDPRKLTSVNVNLLIASLINGEYDKKSTPVLTFNKLGLPIPVEFSKTRGILMNELSNLTVSVSDGQTVSLLNTMMNHLDSKYRKDGFYKPEYLWIRSLKLRLKIENPDGTPYSEESLTKDDIKIRTAFENSFNKLKMDPVRMIFGKDNLIYSTDPSNDKNIKRIKTEWTSNMAALVPLTFDQNKLLYTDNSTGVVKINKNSSEFKTLTDFKNSKILDQQIRALGMFGIKFSAPWSEMWKYDADIQTSLNTMVELIKQDKLTDMTHIWDNEHIGGPVNKLLSIEQDLSSDQNINSYMNAEWKLFQ